MRDSVLGTDHVQPPVEGRAHVPQTIAGKVESMAPQYERAVRQRPDLLARPVHRVAEGWRARADHAVLSTVDTQHADPAKRRCKANAQSAGVRVRSLPHFGELHDADRIPAA